MRRYLGIVSLLLLSGCAAPAVPARATAIPSPSPSPSPVTTTSSATTSPAPKPTSAMPASAKPATTPALCRFATMDEVAGAIAQPVTGWLEATGGCWYRLSTVAQFTTSVKVMVFRNQVAQQDKGEVAVPGLGYKAWWYDGHNLEVQAGRDVVWIDTGDIDADDKLTPAKKVFAVVRKRL
ncbi:hypothetical protein KZZ52_31145 [Dactylosporangium sp. AC04546]|uniref:hypothetical protein n=1 Tax=Dactylosporangium sp. AC04546 TaxID=2862460 RepID=UPI001EDD9692|nr:hypothetical protein [Dactylosporangium sp. AC04546]WVK78451.1 hypothetical protein KZZ52_31145 [Dactylosporangium sp. AC04546]